MDLSSKTIELEGSQSYTSFSLEDEDENGVSVDSVCEAFYTLTGAERFRITIEPVFEEKAKEK